MNYRMMIASGVIMATAAGCMAPKGGTPGEKRLYVHNMKDETLARLYASRPDAKQKVAKAVGYAVFAELETGTGLLGSGSGYGVVVNNETGDHSYMRMVHLSGGIGLGIKHLRIVFLFHTREALRTFITEGWEVGSEAHAVALIDKKGAGAGAGLALAKGMTAYQLTDDGIYLRAAIHAKKFYPDTKLNDD